MYAVPQCLLLWIGLIYALLGLNKAYVKLSKILAGPKQSHSHHLRSCLFARLEPDAWAEFGAGSAWRGIHHKHLLGFAHLQDAEEPAAMLPFQKVAKPIEQYKRVVDQERLACHILKWNTSRGSRRAHFGL